VDSCTFFCCTCLLLLLHVRHYFVQIVDALHAMHQCRVMHRDIKPANVFLSAPNSPSASGSVMPAALGIAALAQAHLGKDGPLMVIKLGDLGLGRYLSSKTYETFSIVGTSNTRRDKEKSTTSLRIGGSLCPVSFACALLSPGTPFYMRYAATH